MPINKPNTKTSTQQKGLIFDEATHTYFYEGKQLDSVTTWIEQSFCTPFEKDNGHIYRSNNKAKSNKTNNNGITNPEVLRYVWRLQSQRASTVGTAVHTYAQLLHLHRQYKCDYLPIIGYDKGVYDCYNELVTKFNIISVEKQVFDLQYLLAGTLDMLLQEKSTGEYAILDWKTFENPDKKHDKMINEMKGLDVSGRNKAAIQMELYNILGNINAMQFIVVWVQATGRYELLGTKDNPLPNIRPQLMQALNKRLFKTSNMANLM